MLEKRILTNSSVGTFRQCRKKYQFAYVHGLRSETDGRALRMGNAYHKGLDVLKKTGEIDAAVDAARECYALCPTEYDQYEWDMERETVASLLAGYAWRWDRSDFDVIESEHAFELPLINPDTGAASKIWNLAGKIDGIVKLPDGRLAVLEHKTCGEDIGYDSIYWRRLQIDPQISIYVYAARRLGYDVSTVLYDVTRKPSIKPAPVALLDANGAKVVLDANGERVKTERGLFRQTGDTAKGYVLQTRPMRPEEWADKLTSDIGERPEYYFARHEIPRLDGEIEETMAELWDLQKTIRDAELSGRWFRSVSFSTCPHCPYFGLCTSKWNESDATPQGMVRVSDLHPELKMDD